MGHEDKHKAENSSRACPWLSGHKQECNLFGGSRNMTALSWRKLNWSVHVSLHVFCLLEEKNFIPNLSLFDLPLL